MRVYICILGTCGGGVGSNALELNFSCNTVLIKYRVHGLVSTLQFTTTAHIYYARRAVMHYHYIKKQQFIYGKYYH